jgi:hypothetical protein
MPQWTETSKGGTDHYQSTDIRCDGAYVGEVWFGRNTNKWFTILWNNAHLPPRDSRDEAVAALKQAWEPDFLDAT